LIAVKSILPAIVLAFLTFLPGFAEKSGISLPLFFFRNAGLADSGISFIVESPELRAGFRSGSVSFQIHGSQTTLTFAGSNPQARVDGESATAGHVNFFIGSQARTDLETYARIRYHELYPGIDATYSGAGRKLKSEFLVAPGANPNLIRLAYDAPVSIGANGDLVVTNGEAELREEAPLIFQDGKPVAGRYRMIDPHTAGFEIGEYDHTRELIIDPSITYSTYLGGTGMGAVTGVAVDSSDNLYVTGWTEAINFPIAGAYQAVNNGGVDAFVAKLNAAGTALVYATYLGGAGDDRGYAVAVDSSGDAYVTGSTASTNFPVANSLRTSLGGMRDAFVTKLNPAGNALVYSTLLGGSNNDWGYAIAVDASGDAYVAGDTQSTDFPVLGAVQSVSNGNTDSFITKLSSSCKIVFSTFLGGSGNEHAAAIALDSSDNVYVAGGTFSTNFPTAGPIQAANIGGEEAFVTKIASSGASLVYSTYLGGSSGSVSAPEQANAIAVDASGNAYIAGVTPSSNFPVSSGAFQPQSNGGADAFAAKINAAGSALVYSTYLGGSLFDQANGIAVDASGNAYVAGYTASPDFPTANAIQPNLAGMYDAFVVSIGPTGSALVFSTYYGGSGSDQAAAIALDASANIFIGGETNSPNFPLTDAYQTQNSGGEIGWVARMSQGQSASGTPDMTIASSHTGNFTQGQTGATYTITASNAGTGVTTGAVTVTETVPSGLTATSMAGNGWTCTQPSGPCTRSDALNAGSSYPPITLTVNVSATAPASVTNMVSVAGGGETNTSNDQASDPTTIQAASTFASGIVTTPTPGSTLAGSTVAFQWTAGTGTASAYWLRVGTTGVGSYDVLAAEYMGTSATVSGIPTNGETVYVRLYSENVSTAAWVSNDYTYTAATGSTSSFVAATISAPTPGSTLTSSTATFQWTTGTGAASAYWLRVGTTGVGSYDVLAAEYTSTSATVSGIPTNGETVYVRLYSENLSAGTWVSNDYTYTAPGATTSGFAAAALTTPTPGATLAGSTVTFEWTAGTGTASLYWLRVGTTGAGSYNIYAGELAGTSVTISGIPTGGGAVNVRLYSENLSTSAWVSSDYTYTAAGGSSSSSTTSFSAAALTAPAPGSTLPGATVTFQWTAGTGTTNLYWLRVGTTGVGSYDVYAGELAGTSATITGIPTNGNTVYVRVYSQNASTGAWASNDYTYTAF
jgi:Domain of unknown function DUF11/Beta-propeller repeat